MNYRTGWWLPDTTQGERQLFENEYLRREFKLLIYSGREERERQLETALAARNCFVLTDNSIRNFKKLKGFPKRSVVLFILSDETYRITLNLLALFNPAVKAIVKDYPLGSTNMFRKVPKLYVEKIYRLKKFRNLWRFLPKSVLSGVYVLLSQFLTKISSALLQKEIMEIPQGYNSSFAKMYAKRFELGFDDSMFEFAFKSKNENFAKKLNLVFLGQMGSLDRRLMLAEAQDLNFERNRGIIMRINNNYIEGQRLIKQEEYFHLTMSSYFTLCPPGNYSGSTFRFFEALISHSYPIRDSFVISDPLFNSRNLKVWPSFVLSKGSIELIYGPEVQYEIIKELGLILDSIEKTIEQIDQNDRLKK